MTPPVEACAVAHGAVPADDPARTLVVVFAGPVARFLLHFAHDVGFRTVLVEPDPLRRDDGTHADQVLAGYPPVAGADVVVADHHRPELGAVLRDVLSRPTRWIGVIGGARHTAPHVAALRDLGVPDDEIARVHRPIGLNIGSRTPPEIALATIAGLIADRNGRPGGFDW